MVPIGSDVTKNGAAALFAKLLLHVGDFEGVDEGLDLAVEHPRELVQREVDAVIGDPILRIIVSADLGGPVTGAHLRLAHPRARRFLLGDLRVEQALAKDFHRLELVLELRFLVLLADDDPAWNMGDANGWGSRGLAWAAGA